jgi:hypothetical protein
MAFSHIVAIARQGYSLHTIQRLTGVALPLLTTILQQAEDLQANTAEQAARKDPRLSDAQCLSTKILHAQTLPMRVTSGSKRRARRLHGT